MVSKEEFENLINTIKDKMDKTDMALVSEELLATISAYNSSYDEYEKSNNEVEKLKTEKEELLKVNGKLYQKIGFDKEDAKEENNDDNSFQEDEIRIEDIISEKGDLI